MQIITLNDRNIAEEHICCAIADKKCQEGYLAKKEWLKQRFREGYVFKKLDVRGKVFIEYGPAENAWAPVEAPGYMLINCLWVSGKYKGQGYGRMLYQECLKDAKNMDGIVAITGDKKRPFLSDRKFFEHMGFELCDTAPPYFELWHLKLNPYAPTPQFRSCTKQPASDHQQGLTVYYTNACPFTEYYVNQELASVAAVNKIPLSIRKIETREQAQNHLVPFTIYSLFYNGRFVTQEILSQKRFNQLFVPEINK